MWHDTAGGCDVRAAARVVQGLLLCILGCKLQQETEARLCKRNIMLEKLVSTQVGACRLQTYTHDK